MIVYNAMITLRAHDTSLIARDARVRRAVPFRAKHDTFFFLPPDRVKTNIDRSALCTFLEQQYRVSIRRIIKRPARESVH